METYPLYRTRPTRFLGISTLYFHQNHLNQPLPCSMSSCFPLFKLDIAGLGNRGRPGLPPKPSPFVPSFAIQTQSRNSTRLPGPSSVRGSYRTQNCRWLCSMPSLHRTGNARTTATRRMVRSLSSHREMGGDGCWNHGRPPKVGHWPSFTSIDPKQFQNDFVGTNISKLFGEKHLMDSWIDQTSPWLERFCFVYMHTSNTTEPGGWTGPSHRPGPTSGPY